MKKPTLLVATVVSSLLFPLSRTALAQGTAFTYQGSLGANGNAANGTYDFQFSLYATSNSATVLAGPLTLTGVGVTNGLFTTTVDFGAGVFAANSDWLAIAVRTNGASTFTALSPRQPVTSAPYAIYAANATSAVTANTANSATTATTAATATSVPAGNISSGTLADARLSSNVALRSGGNAFTGNQSVTGGSVGFGTTSTNYRVSLGSDNLNTKLAIWDGGSPTNAMGLGVGSGQFRIHLPDPSNRFSFLNSSAGAEIMTLLGTGRLGLGTISPGADFHVLGSTAYATETLESFDVNGSWLRLKSDASGGRDWDIISSGPGVLEGAGHLLFYDSTANAVRLDLAPGGRVGIGTYSPGADLHVLGTTPFFTEIVETADAGGTWLRLMNDSTGGHDWDLVSTGSGNSEGTGKLLIHDNSAGNRMVIDTNGNVGIGTSSPSYPLDVSGDVRATGNVRVNTTNYAPGMVESNVRIVRGAVNSDGSLGNGAGFTATHLGTGVYQVTFKQPFSGYPIVTATPIYNSLDFATVQFGNISSSGFTLSTKDAGSSWDMNFTFIAIGN